MTLALVGFGYDSKDIGNKRGNRKVELRGGGGGVNICPMTDSIVKSSKACCNSSIGAEAGGSLELRSSRVA